MRGTCWLLRAASILALILAGATIAAPRSAVAQSAISEALVPPNMIAQDAAPVERHIGPVTNLPLPRFVSLKASEGNVRRGPSLTHRIDWVFTRRNMPLRITAEHGHWRRVEDRDGMGGWVHYSLLSGSRTVIVEKDMLTLHARPERDAPIRAALEAGVIARLGACGPEWCRLTSAGYRGWAPKTRVWGVAMDEVRD